MVFFVPLAPLGHCCGSGMRGINHSIGPSVTRIVCNTVFLWNNAQLVPQMLKFSSYKNNCLFTFLFPVYSNYNDFGRANKAS